MWQVARAVDGGAFHGWAAIVADEKHQGVFLLTGLHQFFSNPADRLVEGQQHGSIDAAAGVGDAWEFRQAFGGCLHRRVHGIEGEIEEPWMGFVVFNEGLGLASKCVGGVVQFLHRLVAAQNRRRIDITMLTP